MLNNKHFLTKVIIPWRGLATTLVQGCRPRPYIHPNPLVQPKKTTFKFKAKHANPRFKAERAAKVQEVNLPDFHQKDPEKMSPEEQRLELKKKGIQPMRRWRERPISLSATNEVMDEYIPPEGDGKASLTSKEGAKEKMTLLSKKGKSMMALRKIRQYSEDFYIEPFCEEAQNIYIKLHEALTRFDEDELHKYATELAYPVVVNEAKNKTLRWKFHGSLEPPRAVHIRAESLLSKTTIFAQITVRFHTQQTLAVYDRFGRLVHGSENVLRDVLEYIVFENYISDEYGTWRVHKKLIPPWMKLRPTSFCTYKVPKEEEPTEEAKEETKEEESETGEGRERELTLAPA